jgi:RNA polymerase sigma factor (sigma-70 family)
MKDDMVDDEALHLAPAGAGHPRLTMDDLRWAAPEGQRHDPARLSALLQGIAAGDGAALERLYRLTSNRLLAIAQHFLGAGDEAEDVIHDVFVTVWRKASLYDAGRARPMAWLTSITRNRCIDRLRSRRRRPQADPERLAAIPDDTPDAHARVEQEEGGRRLLACMDRLSSDQRHAVRRAFYGGQTYEAVARELDVALPTLKSRIRRALILMRQCLQS